MKQPLNHYLEYNHHHLPNNHATVHLNMALHLEKSMRLEWDTVISWNVGESHTTHCPNAFYSHQSIMILSHLFGKDFIKDPEDICSLTE